MQNKIEPRWIERRTPLVPEALVAIGSSSGQLADRLLQDDVDYKAVAADRLLFVLGKDLPWVDGVIYLGREPLASGLFLPTYLRSSIHPVLLARALFLRGFEGPTAIIPKRLLPSSYQQKALCISIGHAQIIDREKLRKWR